MRPPRQGPRARRLLATMVLAAVAGSSGLVAAAAAPARTGAAPARTGPASTPTRSASVAPTVQAEARKVDRVRPTVEFWDCEYLWDGQCAEVTVPRDYDEPDGEQVTLTALRAPALNPGRRLGTLFVTHPYAGWDATGALRFDRRLLGTELHERYDVVALDARGTGHSDPVRCYPHDGAALEKMPVDIPSGDTRADVEAVTRAAKALGRACATDGRPQSASMSSANSARDLEVVRRALGGRSAIVGVGDGNHLAMLHASMFPSSGTRIVLDNPHDPQAWSGATGGTRGTFAVRAGAHRATAAALDRVLDACGAAGPERCDLARWGDPRATWAGLLTWLREEGLDPDGSGDDRIVEHDAVLDWLALELDGPGAPSGVATILTALAIGHDEGRGIAVDAELREKYQGVVEFFVRSRQRPAGHGNADRSVVRNGFTYYSLTEQELGVECSDTRTTSRLRDWPRLAAAAEREAPGFGALMTWRGIGCAADAWTALDADAVAGPFTASPTQPVLVVAGTGTTAAPFDQVTGVADRFRGSGLVTTDTPGRWSYEGSPCVQDVVHHYLLDGVLPRTGAHCEAEEEPFPREPDDQDPADLVEDLAPDPDEELLERLLPPS